MAEAPKLPPLKEFFTNILSSFAGMEANIKKPFIDAGFPEIPTPAEVGIKMAEALPELPAMPALPTMFPTFAPTAPPVEVPTEEITEAPLARAVKYG